MRTVTAVILLLGIASTALAADDDLLKNPRLPSMWKVTSRAEPPAKVTAAISKRLGIEVESLENDVLDAGGVRLQINVARCADEERAKSLQKKFETAHGGDALYVMRRGVDVVEIVCGNRAVARKSRHVIGWDLPAFPGGAPSYYEVNMQVAPLERSDDLRWNRLFNLLATPDDPENAAAIVAHAKSFAFADKLVLPVGAPVSPKATASRKVGDLNEYTFAPLPRVHGVPRVDVKALITVAPFRADDVPEDVASWTASTDAWPLDAPEVRAALADALGKEPPKPARERVERILAWVHAHVRYGSDRLGSRYGVAKVIAQGSGRCWDQSDVFVTLCRAAGVPARLVGGWLHRGEGHVWAQVVLEDELLAVDPGTTWLGVSERYIPLWVTEDGRTPYVYWGTPKIKELASIK